MANQFRVLPNEPILVITIARDSNMATDFGVILTNTAKLKHDTGQHVYRIIDFTAFGDALPFNVLVQGMAEEMHVEGGINDPEVSSIFVGSGKMVALGVNAFKNQAQYGKTNVLQFCASVDEAIACARADIASKKK